MHKHLVIAIAAAGLVPAAMPSAPALAQMSTFCGDPFFCTIRGNNDRRENTNFDLGIDVSDVPLTGPGVSQFMATLSPDGQRIMLHTCQNYLVNRGQVQSPRTIQFCRVLLSN